MAGPVHVGRVDEGRDVVELLADPAQLGAITLGTAEIHARLIKSLCSTNDLEYINDTVFSGYKDSKKNSPYKRSVLISGVRYVVNGYFCTTKMRKIRVNLTHFSVLISGVHCN